MEPITETLITPASPEHFERLGRYTLVREIGRGGMSFVYEARDTAENRRVALKVLNVPPGLAEEQRQAMLARFEREARAIARLSHPNIVAIHEIGEDAGRHFLALELLAGETLRDRLAHGPLTARQSVGILSQIAAAIDAVHAAGVVHRDIKPSNIMLLPDGTAKLLDFGVARQNDDSTVTGTGALVGSPAYMSPEQVRGEVGTNASDIWSLGALVYEMLAGHPPFSGGTIPAVLYQVTHEAPAPVIGVTTPIQKVLRRALEKNPARRYPSAAALAQAFRAALPANVSISARPRNFWPRLGVLLAILLGLFVVVLSRHYRTTMVAPGLSKSLPPAASRLLGAGHSFLPLKPVAKQHSGKHMPSSAQPHLAVPAKKSHHAHSAGRRFHGRARYRRRRVFRSMIRPHHGNGYDPHAVEKLEKFIYSPASPV